MKDAKAWITQWYLALQPFKFKGVHKSGEQTVVGRGRLGQMAPWPMSVCGGMYDLRLSRRGRVEQWLQVVVSGVINQDS